MTPYAGAVTPTRGAFVLLDMRADRMTTQKVPWLLLLSSWAGLFALGACKNGDRAPGKKVDGYTGTRTAELYLSTEVDGYIEPCGCTTKPKGGISRLASVLKASTHERGLIDAGNLLFPKEGLDEVTKGQHLLKARLLARAYRQLGAVALNVAEADLHGGVALLRELQREGALPWVSANVIPAEGGPTVARSFVRKIGGISFGVTGVATPEKLAHVDGITVLEYGPALSAEVKALRKAGAEVVIVLAHVGETGARELAAALPEIDVIIRAPGTPIERDPSSPVRVGPVLIVEAGSQGQHIGRLTFRLGDESPARPIPFDDAGLEDERRRRLTERKIKAYEMELAAWSVDPQKVEAAKAKEGQIAGLKAELSRPPPAVVRPSGPHVAFELIALTDELKPEPQMAQVMSTYYQELAGMNLEKGDLSLCKKPDAEAAVYVGTESCKECHEEAYAFWKKTKHASAWATLEDQGKHFDLTCIGCHTVGYQQPGGFCRLKDVGVLKDVGCEMCHGPGSVHVDDSDPTSIVLEAPPATCTKYCHVPEHSDAFVYEAYLSRITGEGHVLSKK